MKIDFGTIISYNRDRGFGFVRHTFFNRDSKVLFNIKTIREKDRELAHRLDNDENFEFKKVNFWYEIKLKITDKRHEERVSNLWLSAENLPQNYKSDLIEKVEGIWKDIESSKPTWLDIVTIELIGVDRKNELSVERDNLESQLRAAEEERCRKEEALQQNENNITRLRERHDLSEAMARELERLLAEMRPLNFTHSNQLSAYIVKHKLGYRYPNISGIVTMEQAGRKWDFYGGFHPDMYGIICKELGLDNQRSGARAGGFTPYSKLLRI